MAKIAHFSVIAPARQCLAQAGGSPDVLSGRSNLALAMIKLSSRVGGEPQKRKKSSNNRIN